MPNALHLLWRNVERDPRWNTLDPAKQQEVLNKFSSAIQSQFGNVTGLTGLTSAVSERIAKGPEKDGFAASFINQQSDDMLDQMNGLDAVKDKKAFRATLDAMYEVEVETGQKPRSFTGSITGSIINSATQALPAGAGGAGVGAAIGSVGGGVGAVPGAVAGFGRGMLTGMAAAESSKAFGRSLRDNYFSLLDQGASPDEAFDKAYVAAGLSAGITGIANLVSPAGAIEKAAGGQAVGKLGEKVLGKEVSASVNRGLAKAAVPLRSKLNKLPGGTTTGAARFVRDSVVLAGTDDVGFEVLDVAQERVQGIDTSERKGGLLERAALAWGMGSAVRGVTGAATKGFAGLANIHQGRKFSEGLFQEENIRGILGSIEKRIDSAEAGIRQQQGAGYDFKEDGQTLSLKLARQSIEKMWNVLTNGTEPLDVRFRNEDGPDGQDAQLDSAGVITVFNNIFRWEGDAVQRQTLAHEASHGHERTLPPEVHNALKALYQAEINKKSGPLYDENGEFRKNISRDVQGERGPEVAFREWYAEHMALANDAWAKRKLELSDEKQGTFWQALAADFRMKAERVGRMLGFGDGLNRSFRDFLDAGDRYMFERPARPPRVETPDPARTRNEAIATGIRKRDSFYPVLIGGDPLNPDAKIVTPEDGLKVFTGDLALPGDPTGKIKPLVLPGRFLAEQIRNATIIIENPTAGLRREAAAVRDDIAARAVRREGFPGDPVLSQGVRREAIAIREQLANKSPAPAPIRQDVPETAFGNTPEPAPISPATGEAQRTPIGSPSPTPEAVTPTAPKVADPAAQTPYGPTVPPTPFEKLVASRQGRLSSNDLERMLRIIHDETSDVRERRRKGERIIDQYAEDTLFSRRGGAPVDMETMRVLFDEGMLMDKDRIALTSETIRNTFGTLDAKKRGARYAGALSERGQEFENAYPGHYFSVESRPVESDNSISFKIHVTQADQSVATMEAIYYVNRDKGAPELYVEQADVFNESVAHSEPALASLIKRTAKNYTSQDGVVNWKAVANRVGTLSRDAVRLSPQQVQTVYAKYSGGDQPSIGAAMYSELATIAQAYDLPSVTGTVVGPGAFGVRRKVFDKNTVEEVRFSLGDDRGKSRIRGSSDAALDRAARRLTRGDPTFDSMSTFNVSSSVDPDRVYSRRGKKAAFKDIEDELSVASMNGWMLPNGKFIATEPTAAVRTKSGFGGTSDLGNHGLAALDWMERNDPVAADVFWSSVEAKANGHDFDADGPPTIRDSDVYDFMKSRGWVRVVQGGNSTYIEGSPTMTQSRKLKDSAIYQRVNMVHDLGDRERVLYSPASDFARRGGGAQPSAATAAATAAQAAQTAAAAPGGPLSNAQLRQTAAQLPTRQFADRAADTHADLEAIRDRRPDIAFRSHPVDIEAEQVRISHMSDADLDVALRELRDEFAAKEGNTTVMKGLALLERAQALGDAVRTEEAFDVMAKAGTTIGQMLRQYREFKGVARRKNRLEIVKLALLKRNRKLTPQQELRVQGLIDADTKAKDDAEAALTYALDHPTDRVALAKAREAEYKENRAFREMQTHVRSLMPRDFRQVPPDLLAVIQGNLLTPVSTGRNAWGNYVFMVPRLAGRIPAALIDIARSKVTGTAREVAAPSVREAAWFATGTGRGLRKAKDAFLLGSTEDIIVGETIRGFNPVKSFVEAFTGDLPVDARTGKVVLSDRMKKLAEGVFGAAPEAMLRSLSALDELAKDGFRAARAAEETKLRKLDPGTREFAEVELLADAKAKHEAETAALQQTFQNSSTLAKAAQSIENSLASVPVVGGWLRLGYRVATSPYIRTPINLFTEGMKFAMPAFGFMHSAAKALQGDKRSAELSAGYAITGMMMGAAATALLEDDLVSPGPDESSKINDVAMDSGMGFFRLNVSGLQRKMRGESPAYRPGDTTARLDSLGVMGFVLALRAEAKRIDKKDPRQLPNPLVEKLGLDQIGSLVAGGRFAVNQTMLQGAASLLSALERGSAVHYTEDVTNLLTALGMPNTIMAFRQTAEGATRKDLVAEGDPVGTIANVVKYKFGNADELPDRMDLWGRPVKATPAGQNPHVYQLLDIFKRETVRNDVTAAVYALYQKTGNPDVIPSAISRRLEFRGVPLNLPTELYQDRYKVVQGAKGEAFARTVSSEAWQRTATVSPERAVDVLKNSYERAGRLADKRWQHGRMAELTKLSRELVRYQQSR